jgi:hypothetical protein
MSLNINIGQRKQSHQLQYISLRFIRIFSSLIVRNALPCY